MKIRRYRADEDWAKVGTETDEIECISGTPWKQENGQQSNEKKENNEMAKYPLFKDVFDTVKAEAHNRVNPITGLKENPITHKQYVWDDEIVAIRKKVSARKGGAIFTIEDHAKTMLYAILSSRTKWEKVIAPKSALIDNIFSNGGSKFDIEFILSKTPKYFADELLKIRAGSPPINAKMSAFVNNVKKLKDIEKTHRSIDAFYNKVIADRGLAGLIEMLSSDNIEYGLDFMRIPLVCEYLKGMGFEVVKPDTHVKRILKRLHFSKPRVNDFEIIRICEEIADEYGLSPVEVDTILWQFGAEGILNICGATPDCSKCKALTCPSRV